MFARILKFTLLFIVVPLIWIGLWFWYDWHRFWYTPLLASDQAPGYYILEPGDSLYSLIDDLSDQLARPKYFVQLVKFRKACASLKAGEYEIEPGVTTPLILLDNIMTGNVFARYITFVEGWTMNQILQTLRANSHVKQELAANLSSSELMIALGYEHEHPEGLFYPETYQFYHGMSDIALLQQAYELMDQQLMQAWPQRAADLPYDTPYQALIAASLIERETAFAEEKPLVSSVIVNRLNTGMRLQIDPTVIYGLGDQYDGKITRQNLRHDSPYNTYLYSGLPPTPIAMPSRGSIIAALNPADTDYFYFVAKGDGSHKFSRTLEEQNAAVRKYLRPNRSNDQ